METDMAKQVKLFRMTHRKFRRELAEELGVHVQTVRNWEKGKPMNDINRFQVMKLFKKYGFDPEKTCNTI